MNTRQGRDQYAKTEMFESAFKHSGIGMALVDRKGHWIDVNDSLVHMLGYSKEELLSLTFQDITHPDDLETDLALVRKILKKEIDTYGMEKRYIAKDKGLVTTRLTVSPVWNPDGSFKFFISQIVDISINKALIGKLSRQNHELELTRTSLVNKLNQIEELNYMIAHNLRGPAHNIKALSGILREEMGQPRVPAEGIKLIEHDEIIHMIEDGCDALVESLDTLMEVAQISLNKSVVSDDCDVEQVVKSITGQLQSQIFNKKAAIALDLKVPSISYPQIYLESILYNLISNALKYSKPDAEPEISISTFMRTDKVHLSVKDNGLGIDLDKYADRIFKLNQVFHTGYDSKGVGLFITRSQIESMGGSIEVESTPGIGTEFIISF